MDISKDRFTELAKEHLFALESYKIDKNGNNPIEIFGIDKLYEAIIQRCKSDIEQLKCSGCKKPLHDGLCGSCCSDLASGMY